MIERLSEDLGFSYIYTALFNLFSLSWYCLFYLFLLYPDKTQLLFCLFMFIVISDYFERIFYFVPFLYFADERGVVYSQAGSYGDL